MKNTLPPLNSLKAFELSGKHLSVARAAQELGVSSGAVSQQIHSLEKWMGCRLFQRSNRGLTFTPAGEKYHQAIATAFDSIRTASKAVSRPEVSQSFTISVTASFAMKLLLPRLSGFREKWPNVDISVSTVELINKFQAEDGDVGIRYGLASHAGLWCKEIVRDELILVASPSLFSETGRPISIEQLPLHPLLMDQHPKVINDYPSWEEYLRSQGISNPNALKIREFSQQWMVIEASVNGEGIALAKRCLVEDDISAGRLIQVASKELKLLSGYYLVTLPENKNDPIIRGFYRWLHGTLRNEQA